MGNNYYYHPSGDRVCPHCRKETDNLHIGKSSFGWAFSLRVHPTEGISSLEDWKHQWQQGGQIYDEDGELVTPQQMLAIILERNPRDRHHEPKWGLDCRPGGPTYDLCNYEFS